MSKLEVDKVTPQSGTTLTIGEAGDTTVINGLGTLPATIGSATQVLSVNAGATGLEYGTAATDLSNLNATNLTSGTIPDGRFPSILPAAGGQNLTSLQPAAIVGGTFGAINAQNLTNIPGEISWQSTIITANSTIVASRGYWINTTSGPVTITLPAAASVGDTIQIVDYAGTFNTNNLTVNPNGLKIQADTGNRVIVTNRIALTFTFIDSTQGWLLSSGYKEEANAFYVPPYNIDFLVVAGGGGASFGGGGGGGYRTSTQTLNSTTLITVTVGDGGAFNTNGSNSSISASGLTTITSAGGGRGGGDGSNTGTGAAGGSGGGGGHSPDAGGSGNTPSASPVQGYAGGTGQAPSNFGGGGGGGASAVGATSTGSGSSSGGNGGAGTANSITGSSVTYAGGGGGAYGATGGAGGGGNSSSGTPGSGDQDGTANTGGGAGGSNGGGSGSGGKSGGKGVVILSMPSANFSGTTTGSPTEATSGGNKILTFTGSGSYTA